MEYKVLRKTSRDIPIDTISGGVSTTDSNHTRIHEKMGYSLSGKMTVAAGKVGSISIYVPEDTKASRTFNMTNALADLTYQAKEIGLRGNLISILHAKPAPNSPLAVIVSGTTITVFLAVSAGDAITSTATQVAAAVNAHAEASLLVTATPEGAGTGITNAMAEASLTGGALKAYVHFQALSISATSGPCSVSLLEDYTMDAVAAAIAATLSPINHHRIRPVEVSALTVKAYADVAATAGAVPVTLGSIFLPGASTGLNKVAADSGQSEERVLAQGVNYLVAFSNADDIAVDFGYYLFWYEEDAA